MRAKLLQTVQPSPWGMSKRSLLTNTGSRHCFRFWHPNAMRWRLGSEQGGLGARTLSVKVRFSDFRTISRWCTLDSATDSSRDLRVAAEGLLRLVPLSAGVRLLGVAASGLTGEVARQLRLDEQDLVDDRLEQAIEKIRDRWGTRAIAPGRLLRNGD